MPQYGNMVCQKLQSAILLLFFPFTLQEKFCITYNCTCVGNRDCQNFSCWFDPFSPIMSLWSSVFVRLWAASFITWPSKLLLLIFPILWCKSQTEADIFLCCQLSFPINIRACLKVKNKAMFELSNHKRHLKNVWACEKHPPFICSAGSEMSGWNLSWEQAWRITEQVVPVFSQKCLKSVYPWPVQCPPLW